MRLTRRGRALVWTLVFVSAFVFGITTARYSIDYSQGVPQVIDTQVQSRNNDRP